MTVKEILEIIARVKVSVKLAISFSAISTRASLLYTAGLTAQSPPVVAEVK